MARDPNYPCFPDCVEGPPTCGCTERLLDRALLMFSSEYGYETRQEALKRLMEDKWPWTEENPDWPEKWSPVETSLRDFQRKSQ